jgi:hypothetical protein
MAIGNGLEGHSCGIIMVPTWHLCEETRQKKKKGVRAASVPTEIYLFLFDVKIEGD